MALTDKEYDAIRAIAQDELMQFSRNLLANGRLGADVALKAEITRLDAATTEYSQKVQGNSGGHHGI